jgi:metallo-beta-lactamase family protein
MLADSAKIQEEDAAYLNSKRGKGEPKIVSLYEGPQVYRTLRKVKAIPYNKPFHPARGIEAVFLDAGHLLGSAITHLRLTTPEGERTITFTGDLGRAGLPILRDPEPLPAAEVMICESTYGGHVHEPVEETAEKFGEVIRRTVARGGKVIIPAFSVGRTQTIVYFLHQLIESKALPRIPVYVDSPMAVKATEVFKAHPECFDAETLALLEMHPDLFGEKYVHYVERQHESVALNHQSEPCIIISASGMCEAGRVLHHLKHNIEDKRSTILIVGFQAPDTLGRRIVEKRPEVRILGRSFKINAEIVVLNGLSSHADQADILRALAPHTTTTKHIRLVHGEVERGEKLADALRQIGFADVTVPEAGDILNLGEAPGCGYNERAKVLPTYDRVRRLAE